MLSLRRTRTWPAVVAFYIRPGSSATALQTYAAASEHDKRPQAVSQLRVTGQQYEILAGNARDVSPRKLEHIVREASG